SRPPRPSRSSPRWPVRRREESRWREKAANHSAETACRASPRLQGRHARGGRTRFRHSVHPTLDGSSTWLFCCATSFALRKLHPFSQFELHADNLDRRVLGLVEQGPLGGAGVPAVAGERGQVELALVEL